MPTSAVWYRAQEKLRISTPTPSSASCWGKFWGSPKAPTNSFSKKEAMGPTKNQFTTVPTPTMSRANSSSTTKYRQFKMMTQMEKSMPTWPPTAMARAVEGSFPIRETLNRPTPTPIIRMPRSITASRRGYLSFLMSFTNTTTFPRALARPGPGFSREL